MKNKEKFKDKIVDIVCSGNKIAVNKETYEPVSCNNISCFKCLSYENEGCFPNKITDWANQDYKDPIVISHSDSLFLNFIKDCYEYIARDKKGYLYGYSNKPEKNLTDNTWYGGPAVAIYKFNIDFPMIKWTDDQPWKISDLKKLKVVKNY